MSTWKRAFLYTVRKKVKTVILVLLLLAMSTFTLTGLSIYNAADNPLSACGNPQAGASALNQMKITVRTGSISRRREEQWSVIRELPSLTVSLQRILSLYRASALGRDGVSWWFTGKQGIHRRFLPFLRPSRTQPFASCKRFQFQR